MDQPRTWRRPPTHEGRPPAAGRCPRPPVARPAMATVGLCLALLATGVAAQTWRLVEAAVAPSARRNAAAICDPIGRRVVLFGGRGSSGDLADLWAFDLAAGRWEEITPPSGSAPAPRFTHEALYDPVGHRMLIWSGRKVDAGGTGLFNDVWALDLATHTWSELDIGAPRPKVRYGTATVYDPMAHALVTFAGFTDEGRFQDTWRLDLTAQTWVDLSSAEGDPGRRCLHRAALDGATGRMIVYGGQRSGALGDLWALDLGTAQWSELTPAEGPAARFFTALVHDEGNRRLLAFGGDTGSAKLGDLWSYSLDAGLWWELTPGGAAPKARDGAVAVYVADGDCVLLFGGTGTDHYGDTWLLEDLTSKATTAVVEDSTGAAGALWLAAHPNPFNGQVVLRCGPTVAGSMAAARLEIWNLRGQRVRRLPLPPAAQAGTQVRWNGRDENGRAVASGVYLARLVVGASAAVTRLVLAR